MLNGASGAEGIPSTFTRTVQEYAPGTRGRFSCNRSYEQTAVVHGTIFVRGVTAPPTDSS